MCPFLSQIKFVLLGDQSAHRPPTNGCGAAAWARASHRFLWPRPPWLGQHPTSSPNSQTLNPATFGFLTLYFSATFRCISIKQEIQHRPIPCCFPPNILLRHGAFATVCAIWTATPSPLTHRTHVQQGSVHQQQVSCRRRIKPRIWFIQHLNAITLRTCLFMVCSSSSRTLSCVDAFSKVTAVIFRRYFSCLGLGWHSKRTKLPSHETTEKYSFMSSLVAADPNYQTVQTWLFQASSDV